MRFRHDLAALPLICCFGATIVAAQQPTRSPLVVISDSTDIRSLTRSDVMSLLHEAGVRPLSAPTKQEMARGNWTSDSVKNRNKTNGNYGETPGRRPVLQCDAAARNLGISSPIGTWYLFRACSLAINGEADERQACTDLVSSLRAAGNPEAAKQVVEGAPGCMYVDRTGLSSNTCLLAALALQGVPFALDDDLYADNPAKEVQFTRIACDVYKSAAACQRLINMGQQADLQGAQDHNLAFNQAQQQHELERQQEDAAQAAENQAKTDRMNSVLGALQTNPSAAPDPIQQTTVRQSTPQAIPRNEQVGGSSDGNTACHNMTRCVQVVSSLFEKGANQTSGFLHIVVRNGCSQPIRITASVHAQNQSCMLSQTNNFDPGAQEDLGQDSDQSRYFVQADDNLTSGRLGNGCALVVANSCHP